MSEARRYVIGLMQKIAYHDFLPAVLPQKTVEKYSLDTNSDTQYDSKVSGVISVEFNTAAFRFGHTLVSSLIQLFQETSQEMENEALDDNFFKSKLVKKDRSLKRLLRGMTRQRAKKIDPIITDSLRNKLFK